MRELGTLTDPTYTPKESYTSFEKWVLKYIRDERDLPFIYLTIRILVYMVPVGIALYFIPNLHKPLNLAIFIAGSVLYHYLNNIVFKGPFGLMLHCTSHRPWFKSDYSTMNKVLPWIVGPFFGQTPETYFSHHIGMHHLENNMEDDDSSTLEYQRDNFGDFMKYFLKFFFLGIIGLAKYFKKKNRKKLLRKALFGEFAFIIMCVGLSFVNFWATFVVFMLPFLISRLIMMMGNFAQHTYLDATDPGNSYKNSITCINHKYNHKCWNDGYHISHHVKPSLHWTEHPNHLRKNLDKYIENEAIIFEGLDFLGVFVLTMKKRYDKLADHYVNIGNRFQSDDEVIAFLKSRTKKLSFENYEPFMKGGRLKTAA